jgi:hypothetical protein
MAGNLANSLVHQGRHSEAIERFPAVLASAATQCSLGADHPDVYAYAITRERDVYTPPLYC